MSEDWSLTEFQVEVARLFFTLPESDGFLLAGGAALAAQRLTVRPTHDLDLFTRAGGPSVPAMRDAFEVAVVANGWRVRRLRDGDTFCRLVISGPEELLVDLALDSHRECRPPRVRSGRPSLSRSSPAAS